MRLFVFLACMAFVFSSCKKPTEKTSLLAQGVPLTMAKYRKNQVDDVHYELSFKIPKDKNRPIASKLDLKLRISDLEHPLFLDFKEDSKRLTSVSANGKNIPVRHEKEHLIIPTTNLQLGANEIEVSFLAGELSLNRNDDFLYTLLVPDRSRTLFPCFDQPNIKAHYTLSITAPKGWQVLCGGLLKTKLDHKEFTEHQFGKTDKMSTYLFSFVAGKFESATRAPSGFEMDLLYRENDSTKVESSLDRIFELHHQSVSFLEEYTQEKFPFQKLAYATIPGFQYGGMEHVGAIQYRESALFLDESATQNQKLGRAKLIAHETAHMWFGNLVTMDWFNDVWMKEVFANFMADKAVNPVFPKINHALSFMTSHYPRAYNEDRTRGTNPIRQNLDNLQNAGSLYGRIIYNKAPIMMRQLEATMGKLPFQKGVQEYIKTYRNSNADWNQLVSILDKNTPVDLKEWSEVWANQSSRPIFLDDIVYDANDNITKWTLWQEAEDGSDKIWPQTFEITMVYSDSVHVIPVSLSEAKLDLKQTEGLPRPNAIWYNTNGMGYGIFPLDEKVVSDIPVIKNDVARGYAYINSYENVLAGTVTPIAAFEMFQTALQREENELLLNLVANYTKSIFWKYLNRSDRDKHLSRLEKLLYQELRSNRDANSKKIVFQLFQSTAYSHSGKELLYEIWNKDLQLENLNLNEDDYTSLAMSLALYNHEQTDTILEKATGTISNPDKLKRFEFLKPALSSHESIRTAFFESLKASQNREKEAWVLTALSHLNHPLRQETSVQYLRPSLDLLTEIQETGDIFFPKRWLNNSIGRYTSSEALLVMEEFIADNPDLNQVLLNKLLQASDDLYRVQRLNPSKPKG